LLVILPALALLFPHGVVALADIFYRTGALVFGGGHVVLPLLRDALVPVGWISDDRFLAGYGIAQAVPGPLFSFATYVGASTSYVRPPAWGACVAVLSIFLPGMLVTIAGLAFWGRFLRHAKLGAALRGINAAVVGILAAALYNPVWQTAVHGWIDIVIAMFGLLLLVRWRFAPIAVVVLTVTCSVAAGLA
jgi:chromate transporter